MIDIVITIKHQNINPHFLQFCFRTYFLWSQSLKNTKSLKQVRKMLFRQDFYHVINDVIVLKID